MNKLKIEYLSPDDLKGYENNPKIHSEQQIDLIMDSIDTYDFRIPIIVDENNVILDGHARLESIYLLKNKDKLPDDFKVPVIRQVGLDDKGKIALRIAIDKLREKAEWDFEKLNLEFGKLTDLETDFDLSSLGFDDFELRGFDNYDKNETDVKDIEEENVNENVNFIIKCNNINELKKLQGIFKITGKQIGFEKFNEKYINS